MITLPIENLIAAYPQSVMAGSVELRPLTAGGAIALAMLGVDFSKGVDTPHALMSGIVLSGLVGPVDILDEERVKRAICRLSEQLEKSGCCDLEKKVDEALDKAFSTRLPFAAPKGAAVEITPSGLGWALELVEATCAEYGWTMQRCLDMPLVTLFALQACRHRRNGGSFGGPDYVEKPIVERMNAEN